MDTARSIVHSVTHYIKNTDLYLMLLGLVCSIYGMLLIYSATLNPVTARRKTCMYRVPRSFSVWRRLSRSV